MSGVSLPLTHQPFANHVLTTILTILLGHALRVHAIYTPFTTHRFALANNNNHQSPSKQPTNKLSKRPGSISFKLPNSLQSPLTLSRSRIPAFGIQDKHNGLTARAAVEDCEWPFGFNFRACRPRCHVRTVASAQRRCRIEVEACVYCS